MNLKKGNLVYAYEPPIKGEGWPGPEVLGVVYSIVTEGIWVQWPGGVVCLHSILSVESID